MKERVKRERS
jgi:hypothetical protein